MIPGKGLINFKGPLNWGPFCIYGENMAIQVYSDGSSNTVTRKSGHGYLIKSDSKLLKRDSISSTTYHTNNEEEYLGLISALKYISENKEFFKQYSPIIAIKTDSQLMVRQLSGEYRVKAPNLKELYKLLKNLVKELKLEFTVEVEHTYRENNKEADILAKEGYLNA